MPQPRGTGLVKDRDLNIGLQNGLENACPPNNLTTTLTVLLYNNVDYSLQNYNDQALFKKQFLGKPKYNRGDKNKDTRGNGGL